MQTFLIILLTTMFALLLTAKVSVRVFKDKDLRIEVKYLILCFSHNLASKKNNSATRQKKSGWRVASAILHHSNKFEIILHSFSLPSRALNDPSNINRIIRQKIFISTFIAYIESKVHRLIIEDDAFNLSPDTNSFHFDINIKCRLYQLFPAILSVCYELIKKKKVKYNVRE